MKSRRESKTPHEGPDAIALLTEDHREVRAMFKRFEGLKHHGSAEEKAELVQNICSSLAVHMTIEEEIFYPAVREALADDELVDEAEVEHASAKDLIAQLEGGSEDHDDARVTVLGELIEHHVKEEEATMFPRASTAIDLASIGAELEARKAELTEAIEGELVEAEAFDVEVTEPELAPHL
jgi:hemerythrin-like domain-containing protein